jgi:hypothetical protein
VALATLDPLGLPVTTLVVPGNCADDPLYVPEIHKVQHAFGPGGKTFVMDVKGAALATRAYLAGSGDYYLCPLSETQRSAEQRRVLLQPVWQGRQALRQAVGPAEAGEAEGFCSDVRLVAFVNGQPVAWTERRWLVRSLAFAAGQHQQRERRLHQAEEELASLNERKQGKKRRSAAELQAAAEAIVQQQRVAGLLQVQVRTTTRTRKVRRYGDRPARVEKEPAHRVEAARCPEAIEQASRDEGRDLPALAEHPRPCQPICQRAQGLGAASCRPSPGATRSPGGRDRTTTKTVLQIRSSSPSCSSRRHGATRVAADSGPFGRWPICSPLRYVPLRLRRSCTQADSPSNSIRQCWRDTVGSYGRHSPHIEERPSTQWAGVRKVNSSPR